MLFVLHTCVCKAPRSASLAGPVAYTQSELLINTRIYKKSL